MDQKILTGRMVASGAGWSLGSRLVVSVLGLIVGVALTRLMSPEDMGYYFLALSLVPFAVVLAGGGLGQLCVRYVAGHLARNETVAARRTLGRLWSLGLRCAALVGLTAAMVIAGLGDHIFRSVSTVSLALILGVLILATTVQTLVSESFRGFTDMRSASAHSGPVASSLTVLGLLIIGASTGNLDFEGALLVILGSTVVSAALGATALRRRVGALPRGPLRGGPDQLGARDIFSVSLPLLATTALLTVLATADLWVLGAVAPTEDTAAYGVAARTAALVAMPLMVIYGVLGPVIAGSYSNGDRERLGRVLRLTAMVAAIPSVCLAGAFIVAGGPMLAFVYGEHYRAGGLSLAVLSLGQIVAVVTGVCGLLLAMTGHQRVLLLVTGATTVSTVLVLLLVVPTWGMTGAAVISSLGVSAQNIGLMVAARRVTGVWTLAAAPRPMRSKKAMT